MKRLIDWCVPDGAVRWQQSVYDYIRGDLDRELYRRFIAAVFGDGSVAGGPTGIVLGIRGEDA
jgi:hypothetical protein